MKKVFEYSHLGGAEILQVRYKNINDEIDEVIEAVTILKTKKSKEKRKKGKLLYSPRYLNACFKKEFEDRGYSELRYPFKIQLPDSTTINAYKQVDFQKNKVLIEVQFGKYAFMFYDLAKFQYFYHVSQAEVGVEIVPCYHLHNTMSSGVSYGEQLIHDIKWLHRTFPAVPIKIILLNME